MTSMKKHLNREVITMINKDKAKKVILVSSISLVCLTTALAGYKTYSFFTDSESMTIEVKTAKTEDILKYQPLTTEYDMVTESVYGSVYDTVYSNVYIEQPILFENLLDRPLDVEVEFEGNGIDKEKITFNLKSKQVIKKLFTLKAQVEDIKDNIIKVTIKALNGYVNEKINIPIN